ncbi:MAG: hypothetical protein WCN95_05480 [bacterium]
MKLKRDTKLGSAIVTVMIVVTVAGTLVGTLAYASGVRALNAQRLASKVKATAIAEAGVAQAYSVLTTNWAARYNPDAFPKIAYGGGSYDVTVKPVGSNQAVLVSTGFFGVVVASVMADLYNYSASTNGSSGGSGGSGGGIGVGAYGYTIASKGNMGWSGSGDTILAPGGKIHSNGSFKMTGSPKVTGGISSCIKIWLTGSTHITGNAAAPEFNVAADAITGTKMVGSVPAVTMPGFDDTAYLKWAQDHGAYYVGNQHFSSGDVVPNGGIMYVKGDLKISSAGKMVGCFIATGNIDITGSGDQIKVAGYPAFVSMTGDIDIAGSGKSHGLIYAVLGDFDKTGSGDHVGTILCEQVFDAAGSWNLLAYEDSTPVPPGVVPPTGGGSSSTPIDNIGISAWQK